MWSIEPQFCRNAGYYCTILLLDLYGYIKNLYSYSYLIMYLLTARSSLKQIDNKHKLSIIDLLDYARVNVVINSKLNRFVQLNSITLTY